MDTHTVVTFMAVITDKDTNMLVTHMADTDTTINLFFEQTPIYFLTMMLSYVP